MNKEKIVDLVFIILTVLWCAVIFSFSSQDGGESGGLSKKVCYFVAENFVFDFDEMTDAKQLEKIDGMHLFIRKTAHFCVYALLGFLVASVLRRKKPLIRGALSQGFVTLYAISDEIHQGFVSGRNGNAIDVLIDSCGGFCGILFSIILFKIISALLKKRLENNG